MIAQIVPIRIVCVHLCLPNKQVYRVTAKLFGMAISALNSRTKIHVGNPVEWRYALQAFGIPTEIIPTTDTGNIKLDNLKQWIKVMMYTERLAQEQRKNNIVECPGSNDVVFRMGKTMNYHTGNNKFQNLIESQLQYYSEPSTTKAEKDAIEIEIIQKIKKDGGRFLKWKSDKGWWINMSVEMCTDIGSGIDIDIANTTTINATPIVANTNSSINTNDNVNDNVNVNVNMNMNMNVKQNENVNVKQNENVNMSLNSNRSADYFKAEEEIQLKVHYAFRDFKKKMIRAQQKQQQLQVSTSSTYVFEQQDGQKRKRFSNNDMTTITTTTTMNSSINCGNNSSMCIPFLPATNGGVCRYFHSNANDSSYDNNSTN